MGKFFFKSGEPERCYANDSPSLDFVRGFTHAQASFFSNIAGFYLEIKVEISLGVLYFETREVLLPRNYNHIFNN